jgi:hypothetical protein
MQSVRFVKLYEFQQTQSPIRVLNNPSLIIHFCQQKSSLASKQHHHLNHKVNPLQLQTFLNLSIMQFSLILLPISMQCNEPMPLQIPSLTLKTLFRLSPKFFDVCHLTRSVIRLHLWNALAHVYNHMSRYRPDLMAFGIGAARPGD